MTALQKIAAVAAAFIASAGCTTQQLQDANRGLAGVNAVLGASRNPGPGTVPRPGSAGPDMATMPAQAQGREGTIQVVLPPDTRTRDAVEAALPTVKKILAIHQCARNRDALRQLNFHAVTGVDLTANVYTYSYWPNNKEVMPYHDHNKCVSVRAADSWTMPALNAITFRAVFFADDSGETVNYRYLLKRVEDGSWKLEKFDRAY